MRKSTGTACKGSCHPPRKTRKPAPPGYGYCRECGTLQRVDQAIVANH